MAAHRLTRRHVERIWGLRDLPAAFAPATPMSDPIGEIWFEAPTGAELLVKYLFTSERLSIQVHPDDEAARARGFPRGKDEAWYVLGAEPDAVIGLGLTHDVSRETLRRAALDGSIETLLDWKPVKAGDLFYSPAGTIHAIGAGLSLIEIQQNLDLTYRLYDYGRPRELHLEDALAVAKPGPWTPPEGPTAFTLAHRRAGGPVGHGAVVVPIASGGAIDGEKLEAGSVWSVEGEAMLSGEIDALVAHS